MKHLSDTDWMKEVQHMVALEINDHMPREPSGKSGVPLHEGGDAETRSRENPTEKKGPSQREGLLDPSVQSVPQADA